MLDPAIVEPVTVTGEWIIGGMVALVTVILGFVSKLLLNQLRDMREEIASLRGEMLDVMSKSLDIAVNGQSQAPKPRRRTPE
jgi:hypothetical protein